MTPECACKRGRHFTQNKEIEVRLGSAFLDCDVEYVISPLTAARITADPYDSSPAEGGDVEIYKIIYNPMNVETGKPEPVDLLPILPETEIDRLRTVIEEEARA